MKADLAPEISHFLGIYLPRQRNLSKLTILSYRDTIVLLLRFCHDQLQTSPDKMNLDLLDRSLIDSFILHLNEDRGSSTSTQNQRLAAIRSFFRFLQWRQPERLQQCQSILSIQARRTPQPHVRYLSIEQTRCLLRTIEDDGQAKLRNLLLLTLLYDTAARVQEVIDLRPCDLRLERPASLVLTGKGRKSRVVPLMMQTVTLLKRYLKQEGLDKPECSLNPLFRNVHGRKLTRHGVRYLLRSYARKARSEEPAIPEDISPHMLRHSKAMHLLMAGNPTPIIQAILGHADIKTTMHYASADLETKRKALELVNNGSVSNAQLQMSWQKDPDLLSWLRDL